MQTTPRKSSYFIVLIFMLISLSGLCLSQITTPKEHFGHNIGDDYWLATYMELLDYWKKLAEESDRMILEEIGATEEGRPMVMAIITSPENHNQLQEYKDISRKMALAQDLTEDEARALAAQGKAVVWIDGGLHATEVVGAQQEIELVYQMVSRSDPEILRILDNVILLALITNPDGMDLVSNWYMRQTDPKQRSTRGIPRLYQKYIGHDNNRDFYMVTQKETEVVNRILYREWFPQIVYNHHQTGPAGCVLFAPPFREPHSYNIDPLLVLGITTVGNAMHSRFVAEGKPGAAMRDEAGYQTWWNGCLRCTPYFHNMIGILTEMIGNPTPMTIPFIPQKHLPKGDYPFPIAPQEWHFRQSIEYSITANLAILDLAAKLKENFMFNIYRMGRNSIERGSRDHWTSNPKRIQAVLDAIQTDKAERVGSGRSRGYSPDYFHKSLHDPAARDARAYILPSSQADFLTAGKFINTLIKNGITVLHATSDFQVGEKTYPQGSYIVKTAQAFRPHIIDMFEPQFYPDDTTFPGGPPRPPYDSAGYTLAFQMGIEFDRILDDFQGPFEKIPDLAKPLPGKISGSGKAGFLLSHQINDSFIAINQLLKNGEKVYWLKHPVNTQSQKFPAGVIYIPAGRSTLPLIQRIAQQTGLNFTRMASKPKGDALQLKPVRIGLWDRYGGSMASGWVRWILEQFEFDFTVVYPPTLDAGNLKQHYDVLVFVGGAIPGTSAPASGRYRSSQPDPASIPEPYRHMLGSVTAEKTIPQLKQFLKNGGCILTLGSSTDLAYHLGLPLTNALTERGEDGSLKALGREKYFVPGSILQVKVDNQHPLAYGMPEKLDVYINRSPVFRFLPESASQPISPVAWFNSEKSLRSGLAHGQEYLYGGLAVIEAAVGPGRLFLFGPEITFRAQPHGNFKFLFNGIFYGGAKIVTF